MPISEGSFYVHGNLGRDWERKEITSKGDRLLSTPTVLRIKRTRMTRLLG